MLVKPKSVKEAYDVSGEPKIIHKLKTEHDYRYHEDVIKEVNDVTGEFLDKY